MKKLPEKKVNQLMTKLGFSIIIQDFELGRWHFSKKADEENDLFYHGCIHGVNFTSGYADVGVSAIEGPMSARGLSEFRKVPTFKDEKNGLVMFSSLSLIEDWLCVIEKKVPKYLSVLKNRYGKNILAENLTHILDARSFIQFVEMKANPENHKQVVETVTTAAQKSEANRLINLPPVVQIESGMEAYYNAILWHIYYADSTRGGFAYGRLPLTDISFLREIEIVVDRFLFWAEFPYPIVYRKNK